MKALTLVRSGKEDEGLQICEQVKKVIPTDDATLQALTLALKEIGKRKDTKRYNTSVTKKKNPSILKKNRHYDC